MRLLSILQADGSPSHYFFVTDRILALAHLMLCAQQPLNDDHVLETPMLAQDIMTPCAVVCTQHTSLRDAAHLMIENNCRCLPVVEEHDTSGAIIGVVSEHDMICRVVAEGLDPVMSTVWLAMSIPAGVVHNDATVDECILRLRHKQIEHLVVVDRHGAYCGIITQGDIARQRTPAAASEWCSTFSSSTVHASSGRLVPDRESSNRLQAIRSERPSSGQ